MKVDINPQHVIGNLKDQLAQKAEEAAVNAAAAQSAAEAYEALEKQYEDAMKEIANLRGEDAEVIKIEAASEEAV